uniref:Uncharacterized protein n=1 Tax=Tanacetum cinerariifolium TaxID=118510 RepID=A0A6L2K5F0_TANCI|nr:hypothetical protein [Tanacetum cinerariifolium]
MLASMLSPTDSTCFSDGGTAGDSGGESGLDLLQAEDGNSDESCGYQVDDGVALQVHGCSVAYDSLLLTPLCCDDIHDVTPHVSALAGSDRLGSPFSIDWKGQG